MKSILGEATLTRRRKKLDTIINGDGLGDAYAATLSRIMALDGGGSNLGMEVLMWVSHAERPLHVDELCHALGIEGSEDLDIRNIPTVEILQFYIFHPGLKCNKLKQPVFHSSSMASPLT